MKKSFLKSGFTISEAVLTMLIIGIIVSLAVAGVKFFNPTEKGYDTLAIKTSENIEAATTQILLNNASYDNFLRIKDGKTYFSIKDADATGKIANLYTKYLTDVNYNVDLKNEYFSNEIKDYDDSLTGLKLQDAYSNFFYVTDGALIGFRFYQTCKATEENANPPLYRGRYSLENVCGSVFFDINAFKKPNKLGFDQYVLPIYERGIKYNND